MALKENVDDKRETYLSYIIVYYSITNDIYNHS